MPETVPYDVRPVTRETWPDMERLFESRGGPHYCYCLIHRDPAFNDLDRAGRRASMKKRVVAGTPVGLLAYDGDEPVAWCSVAPRDSYDRLAKSRKMPRVDDRDTWTVMCFFIAKPHRGHGLTARLLKGAVKYAVDQGAEAVEGYPRDLAGITASHRGSIRSFEGAGFRREGGRMVKALAPRRRPR